VTFASGEIVEGLSGEETIAIGESLSDTDNTGQRIPQPADIESAHAAHSGRNQKGDYDTAKGDYDTEIAVPLPACEANHAVVEARLAEHDSCNRPAAQTLAHKLVHLRLLLRRCLRCTTTLCLARLDPAGRA
jgi:hypothetical protein